MNAIQNTPPAADDILLKDGVTSVEDAITELDDDKATKSNLTNIFLTGTNTTGETLYPGTYFYNNGNLRRVVSGIGNNASITNSNSEAISYGALNKVTNVLAERVAITSYSSTSNLYTMPYDGYVMIAPVTTSQIGVIYVFGSTPATPDSARCVMIESLNGAAMSLPVRKGMRCYCTGTATCYFVGCPR